ncbi:MAG: hypothetical protein ACOC10_09550 [Bacteroidota bacterium]
MKYIYIILLLLMLAGCADNTERAKLVSQVETLRTKSDSLTDLNSGLEHQIDSLIRETDFWFDNNREGKHLLDSGIEDPREFIISSLKQQPELVPAEPVLGGRMRFTRVQLLGRDCLIASYEDGHIAGRAIYSFTFRDGKLSFSLVRNCPA